SGAFIVSRPRLVVVMAGLKAAVGVCEGCVGVGENDVAIAQESYLHNAAFCITGTGLESNGGRCVCLTTWCHLDHAELRGNGGGEKGKAENIVACGYVLQARCRRKQVAALNDPAAVCGIPGGADNVVHIVA